MRPWQHVLEPLSGYLNLCEKLIEEPKDFSEAWNFGPKENSIVTVSSLINTLVEHWGESAKWIHDESIHPHEAKILKLDSSKAMELLNWHTRWNLDDMIFETIQWYKNWQKGSDMHEYSISQINKYENEKILE
jgi:CDP-glucose 4,6-dehydratase